MIRLSLAALLFAGCQTVQQSTEPSFVKFTPGEEIRCRKTTVTLIEQSEDGQLCTVEQQVGMGIFLKPVRGIIHCDSCEKVN